MLIRSIYGGLLPKASQSGRVLQVRAVLNADDFYFCPQYALDSQIFCGSQLRIFLRVKYLELLFTFCRIL